MFAFAANHRDHGHRDQRRRGTLRAKLSSTHTRAHDAMDGAAHTLGARIETLSKLLLSVARLNAADEDQARTLAHTAFERLIAKDPALGHFWQIVGVLRDELEAREQTEGRAEAPQRAHCVAP